MQDFAATSKPPAEPNPSLSSTQSPHRQFACRMHYRGRADVALASFTTVLILIFLSIFLIRSTVALPSSAALEIRMFDKGSTDITDNARVNVPPSRLHRVFNDWIGVNRARTVAEVTHPHIKRWHGRKRYRGVHH